MFTDSRIAFLANYTFDLGYENLVPFGVAQYVPLLVVECGLCDAICFP